MNAALNVFVENLAVSNWGDVANSEMRMLVWQDTSAEALLKRSPEGSMFRQIYEERIGKILTASIVIFLMETLSLIKALP